jgi:hypothetical protein
MDTASLERGRERTGPGLREVCGSVHFCFDRCTGILELCQRLWIVCSRLKAFGISVLA